MICPSCNSLASELLECDACKKVGCVRCVVKMNKQWMCNTCKTGAVRPAETVFSMFD